MSRAELELEYQRYLTLRDQANVDWQRLARITALVAEQFMERQPARRRRRRAQSHLRQRHPEDPRSRGAVPRLAHQATRRLT